MGNDRKSSDWMLILHCLRSLKQPETGNKEDRQSLTSLILESLTHPLSLCLDLNNREKEKKKYNKF